MEATWQHTWLCHGQVMKGKTDARTAQAFTKEIGMLSEMRHSNILQYWGCCCVQVCCVVAGLLAPGTACGLLAHTRALACCWVLPGNPACHAAEQLLIPTVERGLIPVVKRSHELLSMYRLSRHLSRVQGASCSMLGLPRPESW